MTETCLKTVHISSNILAQKGKHQVGAVPHVERVINATYICYMNAVGEFVSPILILKCKRMIDALKCGGHRIRCIKCLKLPQSQESLVLLNLDGHLTHTKNIGAINLVREYGE